MNLLPKSIYFTAALAVIYLGMIPYFLAGYVIADVNLWMSIILLPYIARVEPGCRSGLKFFWFTLSFLILSVITGVATFFFFAVGFAILFLIDNTVGKINWLLMFVLGLICPAFKYFSNIFGFAVRLRLSEIVGNILQAIGMDIQVTGNVMVTGQCEFSVDPACVGLKMMAVSILAGLLIMAYFERYAKRSFNFITVSLVVILVLILNIVSNLFRIMLLVMLQVLPENPAHDMIGVLCLLIYVIVPTYFIVKKLATGPIIEKKQRSIRKINCRKAAIHLLLLTAILIGKLATPGEPIIPNTKKFPELKLEGFTKTVLDKEVTKYERPGVLIYVKPIRFFYGTDHNPMICWKGSGYEFKKIKEIVINGRSIYSAVLERGTDKLYSAWWYDNGGYQTIQQTDWRWKASKGDNFILVNVSCGTEKELQAQLNLMIGGNE
jgi:exosortase N